jgi:hypothetical protein
MRQGFLLTTHYIFKEEPLYNEHTNIQNGWQVPIQRILWCNWER